MGGKIQYALQQCDLQTNFGGIKAVFTTSSLS